MTDKATFTKLHSYQLTGVGVTNKKLRHGSYANVLELEYMGLKCAGKKIYEVLLEEGGTSYSVRRFEEECRLLSQVHHPNIVQFLGLYFQHGVQAPILVMEFLSTNLISCIEQYGTLPKEISYSIFHDLALGLCYLHSQTPPIIHRDLSSNNVLLTPNMTAKISDLGVARILNLTPLQVKRLTQAPGTPAFMPPEVMVASPNYNTSVDTFSYGVMLVHVFSGRWPEPHIGPVRTEAERLIPVSEAERREVFLQSIGKEHPLMDLILKCIDNHPPGRACAEEIAERLAEMMSRFPMSFVNRLDMLRHIESAEEEKKTLTEEAGRKDAEIDDNNVEIECSRELIKSLREEIERGNADIRIRDELIASIHANEQQLLGHITTAEKEKKSLKEDVKRKKADIERKSAEINGLKVSFKLKEQELLRRIESAEEANKALQKAVLILRANEIEYTAATERLKEDVHREQHKNEEMLKLIHRHEFEIVQLKKMILTPVQFLKADDGNTSSRKDNNVDVQVSHLQGSNAKKDCTKTQKVESGMVPKFWEKLCCDNLILTGRPINACCVFITRWSHCNIIIVATRCLKHSHFIKHVHNS